MMGEGSEGEGGGGNTNQFTNFCKFVRLPFKFSGKSVFEDDFLLQI